MFGVFASANAPTLRIKQQRTVFLVKRTCGPLVEQIQNHFAGPAQAHAFGRTNDGPVDENGMGDHGVEQRFVVNCGSGEAHLFRWRFAHAQRRLWSQAGGGEQANELRLRPARFKIIDNDRPISGGLNGRTRIARRAAFRIVINCDVHVGASCCDLC